MTANEGTVDSVRYLKAMSKIESLEVELRDVQIVYDDLKKKFDLLDQMLEECFEKNYIDYDYSNGD